jgi:hypothetical protein
LIWLFVAGAVLLVSIVSTIRSRHRYAANVAKRGIPTAQTVGTTPNLEPVEAARDDSKTEGSALGFHGETKKPLADENLLGGYQAKYFPPTHVVESEEEGVAAAKRLMEAAEHAAAAEGVPTDFERACFTVREDMSMTLLLTWSAPIPARAVDAVANAIRDEAKRMGWQARSVRDRTR